ALDPDKIYVQITKYIIVFEIVNSHSVKPYFEKVKQTRLRSNSLFERNTNVGTFFYETPFVQGKRDISATSITEVHIRRNLIKTVNPFPYITTRVEILSEKEIILTPIEAATEMIEEQNKQLIESMKYKHTLKLTLAGALRASVNGGPKDIVKS